MLSRGAFLWYKALSLCLVLGLSLCSAGLEACHTQEDERVPGQSPPQNVADQLGRPVEILQEIDRRPLPLAFVEGRYETYVVRDVVTGERLEVTLDLGSGRRVDPAELRSRDRQLAAIKGSKLEPELLVAPSGARACPDPAAPLTPAADTLGIGRCRLVRS
jgi:hypothetical protein